eukprot:maker-scaffold_22-snap-gene-1.49-mRNA-1 protein AED:0.71 eAED:0.86 QI:0/0/0/0.2/1/1/5/0/753
MASLGSFAGQKKLSTKEFYRLFRQYEKESLSKAFEFARTCPTILPEWRVLLELSDAAKRSNEFNLAKTYYEKTLAAAPSFYQGYIEYAKMEEECGRLANAEEILTQALNNCSSSEQIFPLIVKAIKFFEKSGNIDFIFLTARKFVLHENEPLEILKRKKKRKEEVLDSILRENARGSWKLILEFGLVLWRLGDAPSCERILRMLLEKSSFSGPVYFEAATFFWMNGNLRACEDVLKVGRAKCPRFGPIWFLSLKISYLSDKMRLAEKFALSKKQDLFLFDNYEEEVVFKEKYGYSSEKLVTNQPIYLEVTQRNRNEVLQIYLQNTFAVSELALQHVSKELIWKIYTEISQLALATDIIFVYESKEVGLEVENYLSTLVHEKLVQATSKCSKNLLWKILVTCAKLEIERVFRGCTLTNKNASRSNQLQYINRATMSVKLLLEKAMELVPDKNSVIVHLEFHRYFDVLGEFSKAETVLQNLLSSEQAEWKVYLEALLFYERQSQFDKAKQILDLALEKFPVSFLHIMIGTGRLWTLAVGTRIEKGPQVQRDLIIEALKGVPKSGEVWCEYARLCLNPLSKFFNVKDAERYLEFAFQFTPQYGDSFMEFVKLISVEILLSKGRMEKNELITLVEQSEKFTYICQKCLNSNPNYGSLWFACSGSELLTPIQVIRFAMEIILSEVTKMQDIYLHSTSHETSQDSHKWNLDLLKETNYKIGDFRWAISGFGKAVFKNQLYKINLLSFKKFILGIETVFY